MTAIYVDADACPVKNEVYKAAAKYGLAVFVVGNAYMRVPASDRIQFILVDKGLDVADDWIAEHAGSEDIVITSDIPLADRVIKSGARVLNSRGAELTPDSIGEKLAARNLNEHLRMMGIVGGGPAPLGQKDRSQFSSKLHQVIQSILRPSGK